MHCWQRPSCPYWYWAYSWATHGEPNDRNAHPHTNSGGKLAMIHNGIIENYAQLKKELVNKGYTFKVIQIPKYYEFY